MNIHESALRFDDRLPATPQKQIEEERDALDKYRSFKEAPPCPTPPQVRDAILSGLKDRGLLGPLIVGSEEPGRNVLRPPGMAELKPGESRTVPGETALGTAVASILSHFTYKTSSVKRPSLNTWDRSAASSVSPDGERIFEYHGRLDNDFKLSGTDSNHDGDNRAQRNSFAASERISSGNQLSRFDIAYDRTEGYEVFSNAFARFTKFVKEPDGIFPNIREQQTQRITGQYNNTTQLYDVDTTFAASKRHHVLRSFNRLPVAGQYKTATVHEEVAKNGLIVSCTNPE